MPDWHPSEDVRERYSLGRLSAPETDTFEDHLLLCAICQEAMKETDAFVRVIRQAAAEVRAERERRALARRPAGLATIFLAAAVVLAVMWTGRTRTAAGPDQPPVAVWLETTRAAGPLAHAPAGKPLELHLDSNGLPPAPSYWLEIADARGAPVLESRVASTAPTLTLRRQLPAGRYWVRLYGAPRDSLLREFGLQIR